MTSLSAKTALFLAFFITLVLLGGIRAEMLEKIVNLPKSIGEWTRPDSARIIDSSNIFQYMNGAGELYLSYNFDHLEVYEYTKTNQQDSILVEVYVMNTSNDAFGLFSIDWGGEPIEIHSSPSIRSNPSVAPPARALYGGGLLRLCADTIYARVMVYPDTSESKGAVLSLGRKIAAGRKMPAEPELLKFLPKTIGSNWKLRKDRIGYFRSHLVLNSLYYLSYQNILNLDHSAEAVTAPYENISNAGSAKSVQLLVIEYASAKKAKKGLDQFHSAYLHEHQHGRDPIVIENHMNFFNIEDGWLGYSLNGTYLSVVFECPNRASAQTIINHISRNAVCNEKDYGK